MVLTGILAGCSPGRVASPVPRAAAPAAAGTAIKPASQPAAEYVGSAACIPCHTAEGNSYLHSRHATTLRSFDPVSLGWMAPPGGRIPGSDIVLDRSATGYTLHVTGAPKEMLPVQLAVGSGRTGMTFLAYLNGGLMELQKSYFPRRHLWYTTPGHEKISPHDIGLMYSPADARRCMFCHATTLPIGDVLPESRFFGVGCESCHGPGSLHVAAMKSGKGSDLHMPDLAAWPAKRLNDLCGRCHRTAQDVEHNADMVGMTNRLQPYGLMLSRCYRDSGERLSCVLCHNPHSNTSTNPGAYTAACLSCHSTTAHQESIRTAPPKASQNATKRPTPKATQNGSQETPATNQFSVAPKICPVNPRDGCIGCHMPFRRAFPHGSIPTLMPDHRIAIYPRSLWTKSGSLAQALQ